MCIHLLVHKKNWLSLFPLHISTRLLSASFLVLFPRETWFLLGPSEYPQKGWEENTVKIGLVDWDNQLLSQNTRQN